MDFTREPVVESVITPKEGCKLVIRSSKGAGQEEFFVDSVEVVSFSNTFFFRSLERPKAFLVPSTDYEILEVREPRMVLKTVGLDRTAKAGRKRKEVPKKAEEKKEEHLPRKKEQRRHQRRRRGQEPVQTEEAKEPETKKETPPKRRSSLIPPPSTLISETIEQYRDDDVFKDVFMSPDDVNEGKAFTQISHEEAPQENNNSEPIQESSDEPQ